jgi:hypothetical protein
MRDVRKFRIGSIEAEFPGRCGGQGDLMVCPDIVRLIQQGQDLSPRVVARAEKNAIALGQEACQNCPGLGYAESDSGMTWTRRCNLSGTVEESN